MREFFRRLIEMLLADTEPHDLGTDDECAGPGCSRFTPCSWTCERRYEEGSR